MRNLLATASALALAALPLWSGVAARETASDHRPGAEHPPTDAQVKARIDDLLARMTEQEKAGQLSDVFVFDNPTALKAAGPMVAAGKVGSLLFVTDPAEINRLQRIAVEESRLHIPLLFGFDVVHGLTTILPVPIANAASWDPAGVERAQSVAALEARAVGVHWTFGPMVDIARDGRWGRIVEGAGEDPYLGSAMAAAQVRGFQGPRIGTPDRIIAGPKHFVGYGAAIGGRDYEEAEIPDEALWNVYLPPFKAAIDAGAGNIMSAYMPLNGIPTSGNHWLLTDVLRKTWGFKGFVVSDAGAVESLRTHGFATDYQEAAAKALSAGVDMEMTSGIPKYRLLPDAIAAGQATSARLDEAVRRVLEAKIRMGLFEKPYVDEKRAAAVLADRRHLAVAREAAERAAVLLRNENGTLPLDTSRVRSVAVIGALATSGPDMLGPWVFKQNHPPYDTVLDGIRERAGSRIRVTHAPGVSIPKRLYSSPFGSISVTSPAPVPATGDDDAAIAQAVRTAGEADVAIVVLGERQEMSGEFASSSTFALPGRQREMLDAVVATGKPVVVVLLNGRPLDLGDTKAAAILEMWYPGSAGGAATARLLFGDVAPGGKLPITWPRDASQVPFYYAHLTTHDPVNHKRRYWNEPSVPTYPFGHGLSYSTFTYSNLKIDRPLLSRGVAPVVTVDLANTGTRTADEVAQLYIHQRTGTQARPVRELKGFQRVTLKPGERRTLRFALTPQDLRYWNSAVRDWVADESVFDVAVGGDSTAKFGGTFEVKGG